MYTHFCLMLRASSTLSTYLIYRYGAVFPCYLFNAVTQLNSADIVVAVIYLYHTCLPHTQYRVYHRKQRTLRPECDYKSLCTIGTLYTLAIGSKMFQSPAETVGVAAKKSHQYAKALHIESYVSYHLRLSKVYQCIVYRDDLATVKTHGTYTISEPRHEPKALPIYHLSEGRLLDLLAVMSEIVSP